MGCAVEIREISGADLAEIFQGSIFARTLANPKYEVGLYVYEDSSGQKGMTISSPAAFQANGITSFTLLSNYGDLRLSFITVTKPSAAFRKDTNIKKLNEPTKAQISRIQNLNPSFCKITYVNNALLSIELADSEVLKKGVVNRLHFDFQQTTDGTYSILCPYNTLSKAESLTADSQPFIFPASPFTTGLAFRAFVQLASGEQKGIAKCNKLRLELSWKQLNIKKIEAGGKEKIIAENSTLVKDIIKEMNDASKKKGWKVVSVEIAEHALIGETGMIVEITNDG